MFFNLDYFGSFTYACMAPAYVAKFYFWLACSLR